MSDFQDALDAQFPTKPAGALPSSRTFSMVTDAIASGNVDELKDELQHSRAHYQSLEYMLASEERIVQTILGSWGAGAAPEPTTIEEAIRLTARVYATEVLMAAYETAHQVGFYMAVFGMDVQTGLQQLYSELDFSDPEREVSDQELRDLLDMED